MRRRLFQLAIVSGAIVVLGVLARFGWVLATTNTAGEILLRQGRDTLFCLTSGFESDKKPWLEQDDEEQITDLPPVEQARFWVAEVDRILAEQPETPELLMGAALVLDRDATWLVYYMDVEGISPEGERAAKRRRRQPYERISGPRCLEFARRATELAPSDPRVWRVRAYTLFAARHDMSQPRQEDWRAVLDRCRAHDEPNALYDYLEAEYLFGLGSFPVHSYSGDWKTLRVSDSAVVAEATAAVERGAKLPLLVDDRKLHDLSRRIADRAACPEYSREDVAWSSFEIDRVVDDLIEYLACLAERHSERNDVDGELKAAKLRIRLVEQVMAARPDQYAVRHAMAVAQVDLFQRSNVHSDYVDKEMLKSIEQDAVEAVLALKLEFASQRNVEPKSVKVDREMLGLRLMVMLLFQPALWLCAAGVVAIVAYWRPARLRGISLGSPAPPLGVCRHVVVWLVALTCSFVLFGFGPGGLVPDRVAVSVEKLYWTAVLAFCALAVGLLIFWRRKIRAAGQDRQRRRRLLHGGALVMLLFVAIGVVFNVTRDFFLDKALARPGWEFSPPLASHGWFYEPITADLELPPLDRSGSPAYLEPLLEWSAYAGVLLAAAMALPLVALWRMRRIARRRRMSILRYWLGRPPNRRRWAAVIRSVANSALVFAAVLILTWMALFPSLLAGFEHNETVRRWYARPQPEIDADYARERQRILNDPQEMQSLRNRAQADVLAGELTWN